MINLIFIWVSVTVETFESKIRKFSAILDNKPINEKAFKINLNLCYKVVVQTASAQADGPVVKTASGDVQGKLIKSYEGRTVTAFEGIPYAKPPIGELRFKEPQPAEPWSKTLVADKNYVCMQYTFAQTISEVVGDEDCLYLYVYVPREKIEGTENLDVVVHIHGGAFTYGDPKSLAGPDYIMDRDLVFVSMNYRLGILGFLSTQDEVVPGNNGLKDQVLAMKWVKDNIKNFGGNPNSITLTGAASGGALVHYHYLSPLSTGLFNRGFSQSGTALNMWALRKNPIKYARTLGENFGCKLETSKELVDCLREKPVKEVVLNLRNFTVFANSIPLTPFGPVIEYLPGAFLPDHPYKLLLEGRINDYPWITSNVRDEGVVPVGYFLLQNKLQELGNRWNELAPYALDYNDTVAYDFEKTAIAKIIRQHYLGDEPLSEKIIYHLIKLFTDRYFRVDAIRAVSLHASVAISPVYYYTFDYSIEMPLQSKANLSAHGDDIKMLYKQVDSAPVLSDSDRKMKNVFIDFLYRYASTGKPDFKGVEWKPIYSPIEPITYLHISSPDIIRREQVVNLEPSAFWHSLHLLENEHLFGYLLNFVPVIPLFR